MLSWVVTFLIVALIAGILGFGGIAGVSIEIAKTIFFIAVVLFLISAVVGLARRSDARVIELLKTRLLDDDCRVYELEAAEEMPRPELLEPLQRLRDDVERLHDIDPTWHRHLLDAIDACELVADATP